MHMHRIRIALLGLAVLVVASGLPDLAQASQRVGVSQSHSGDVGMFSVANPTNVAIRYQVKWGNGQWKDFIVEPGTTMKHWYNLDRNDRAPVPYVQFDNTGGDGRITLTKYEVDFAKVGNGRGTPKGYKFRYAGNGRALDLVTAR